VSRQDHGLGFEHTITIAAASERILNAFFDPAALMRWWDVRTAIVVPRPLGVYALAWATTVHRDDVLGPLGGVFYGIVAEYAPEREFFVADAYWLPPEGDPIGPMGLEVSCAVDRPLRKRAASGLQTRLRVRQSGYEEGARWSRYYSVVTPGWLTSLRALKVYLEE
jgi:hypothetical protein